MTKTARWLDLVAYLLHHRYPVTREQIFESVVGYHEDSEDFHAEDQAFTVTANPGRKPGVHATHVPDAALERRRHESARRKFERDKDELRALGIDIVSAKLPSGAGDEPQDGYILKAAGFYLPAFELTAAGSPERPYQSLPRLQLSEAEVTVLDRATRRLAERSEFPLGAAAASARRKLAFDLPLDEIVTQQFLAAPISESARQALELFQDAVSGRMAVTFEYLSLSRNVEESREVEPWGLFFQWSNWYLVGRDRARKAVRVFRLDRVRGAAAVSGSTFDVPEAFQVREYVGRAPWEFGDRPVTAVLVRFAFPESRWVINRFCTDTATVAVTPNPGRKPGVQATQTTRTRVVDELNDGSVVVEFAARDRAALLRWLLTFRRQATILGPNDVVKELDDLRRRVAALYDGSDD